VRGPRGLRVDGPTPEPDFQQGSLAEALLNSPHLDLYSCSPRLAAEVQSNPPRGAHCGTTRETISGKQTSRTRHPLLEYRRLLQQLKVALIAFGPLGVLVLALLDSCGVPLPGAMDASLIYVAWHSPALAYWTASAAVLGSLVGNIGLFLAARHGVRRFVREPDPDKPQKFRQWFDRYGLITVFIPALVPFPLPMKPFVVSAGVMRTRFLEFLAVVLVGRLIRYVGEAYLGVNLGQDAQGFLLRNGWTLTAIALALAFVLFVLVWLNDRRRTPAL